jgi:hypothetical protein
VLEQIAAAGSGVFSVPDEVVSPVVV